MCFAPFTEGTTAIDNNSAQPRDSNQKFCGRLDSFRNDPTRLIDEITMVLKFKAKDAVLERLDGLSIAIDPTAVSETHTTSWGEKSTSQLPVQ